MRSCIKITVDFLSELSISGPLLVTASLYILDLDIRKPKQYHSLSAVNHDPLL